MSGWYSTNPAIWLVPRVGSILPFRPAHSGSGSFRNHLLGFRKKCYSPAKVSPYWEKLCPLSCLSCFRYPRPRAQFFPIRTSRLVNNIYERNSKKSSNSWFTHYTLFEIIRVNLSWFPIRLSTFQIRFLFIQIKNDFSFNWVKPVNRRQP